MTGIGPLSWTTFVTSFPADELSKNFDAVYDYRNLLVYISSVRPDPLNSKKSDIFSTYYYYDEAGNRIRKKVYKRNAEEPEIELPGSDGPGSSWDLVTDEFCVRDAAGKEIANYSDGSLNFWNIYGNDNVGRINADTTKQFYLKDHLGTTRAVTDATNEIIAAHDFDAWGYKLREWNSGTDAKYRFTGKERDIETNYDYFGARYYDARIGRWGGVEPLYNKYIQFTPYNYALNTPVTKFDINGMETGGPGPASSAIYEEPGGGPSNDLIIPVPLQGIVSQIAEKVGSQGALGFILSVDAIVQNVEEARQEYIQSVTMEMSNKKGKLEGVETQLERVEEHLEKLSRIGPNDPNPDGKRKEWISHTTKALREGAKDFKSAFRKVSGKDYLEYLYKTFGKDRIEKICNELQKNGIDYRDFIK
jgi:RHS repeat-associated protein